jgi:hypothetical protein
MPTIWLQRRPKVASSLSIVSKVSTGATVTLNCDVVQSAWNSDERGPNQADLALVILHRSVRSPSMSRWADERCAFTRADVHVIAFACIMLNTIRRRSQQTLRLCCHVELAATNRTVAMGVGRHISALSYPLNKGRACLVQCHARCVGRNSENPSEIDRRCHTRRPNIWSRMMMVA